ncbi:MAG: uncharacterized protein A8A55_3541, partial [Amphiamblys sp. WSBS2006]
EIFHPLYHAKFILDITKKDLIPISRIKIQASFLKNTYRMLKNDQGKFFMKTTGRELNIYFHNFLRSFFPKEHDVRSFSSLEEFETDVMARDSDRYTLSIVRVKRNDDGDLEEDIFHAALYALKWCAVKGKA